MEPGMTAHSSAFGIYFRDHLESGLDKLALELESNQSHFTTHTYQQRRVAIRQALLIMAEGIINDDQQPVIDYARGVGERRARDRFSIEGMLVGFAHMRGYVWEFLTVYLETNDSWTPHDVRAVEDILQAYQRSYFGGFSGIYQAMQVDLAAQAAALEQQRALIQELSSPIVPIYHGVLLLPLVGTIDETRAARIIESVLDQISRSHADIMLVDITGVPVVDLFAANHIVNLTRAVSLLGAQVVLVGIRPEMAQTIVQLGMDVSGIVTFADLQAGMVYALRREGAQL
jgi:rsbT co-antagonist protein RsbR